jgi:hypothetical protein
MMSRQVNFFLTPADQAALMAQFAGVGEFALIDGIAPDRRPQLRSTAENRQMGVERLTIYLVRPQDVDAVVLNDVKGQPYRVVDVMRSPVIEFDRCYQAGNLLRRGRLYFVTGYYDEQTLAKKDHAFVDWADAFLKKARRSLKKDQFFHFGAEALKLKEAGAELAD